MLGLLAGFMAIGWLFTDLASKGFGYWLEVLGGIAIAAGAWCCSASATPARSAERTVTRPSSPRPAS